MDNKTSYYDPIYNQIVLPNMRRLGGPSLAQGILTATMSDNINKDLYRAIHDVLKNDNYDRLSFLYQSGIAWLVFPSATHTRFSHSLGCYHLGTMALESIHVYCGKKTINLKLSDWLSMESPEDNPDNRNLYYQCLLLVSLLCHDIGHFPFSHTMELNYEIDIEKSHEDRILSILGDSFYKSFNTILSPKHNMDNDNNKKCFRMALEYLITGDRSDIDKEEYERDCLPENEEKLKFNQCKLTILKRLVSGLLDLDRIDHYLRDSFFAGIKLANFNIEQLLRGMTFIVSHDLKTVDLALNRDALIHAKNLLHSKEQISDAMFENPDVINYEIILNQCITKYKMKFKDSFEKVYCMHDWQLLDALFTFMVKDDNGDDKPPHDKDRVMFERILKKNPLYFIGKFIIRGKYSIDFATAGGVEFKYAEDIDHTRAIADFYKFALDIDLLEENPLLPHENEVTRIIRELLNSKRDAIRNLINVMDEKTSIVVMMKYLFSHKLHKNDNESTLFINKKEALWRLAGKTFKRMLRNAVKRTFANKLNIQLNLDLNHSKERDYLERKYYFKFSKKFLDFYHLSQDVADFAAVVIDKQKDSSGNYKRIANDIKEKEFLRMFAAQDIKSRINMWIYSDSELKKDDHNTIVKSVERCGFASVRG